MDERVWTDRPLDVGGTLHAPDCVVTRGAPGALSLISGDLSAALAALSLQAELLGFAAVPDSPTYALRIGRDHALLVTPEPPQADMGWHAQGFALSDAGGAYARLDLQGPGAMDLLAHGLAAPAPEGSPSAALQFCGARVLVSGLPDGLSLWVDSARLTACCSFLATCVQLAKERSGSPNGTRR